jgi:hypothetical protein
VVDDLARDYGRRSSIRSVALRIAEWEGFLSVWNAK